jgi:hypothetical protein
MLIAEILICIILIKIALMVSEKTEKEYPVDK